MGSVFILPHNERIRGAMAGSQKVYPCKLCSIKPRYECHLDFYLDKTFVHSLSCKCSLSIEHGPYGKQRVYADWNFYQLKMRTVFEHDFDDMCEWFFNSENLSEEVKKDRKRILKSMHIRGILDMQAVRKHYVLHHSAN